MNRKPEVKNQAKTYQKQKDYGQYDHVKKYRDDEKDKNDYQIYEKEDYSQYVQQNGQDQYYYEAEEFDEQHQKDQNEQEGQDDNNYEEVPNIKKILAKKTTSNEQQHQQDEQQINQDEQEEQNDEYDEQQYSDDNNHERGQEDEDGEQEEQLDNEYERNEEERVNKQNNKKQFKKYEDQNEDDYDNDEEQHEQEEYSNQSAQQPKRNNGILKSLKQNSIPTKNKQKINSGKYQDDEDEDDPEQETEYPENSNQTQSSKSESNYMKNTKSFSTKEGLKKEEKTLSKMSEPFDNIYNTKKYPLGIVDDPSLEDERKNLWKTFGRDCAAGRELFALYKCHQPPKMNYPKPKQKTADELLPKPKEIKPCPQKAQISYPPLSYKEPKQRFHKVDFIPKRKPESEIRKELDEMVRNPYVPINTGKNRQQLIEKLQQKFKYLRGGLPKAAELPFIDENQLVFDEEKVKAQAQKRIGMKNKVFTGQYEDRNDNKTVISDDPVQECNELFEQIMTEIEERQEYLESIKHLKEPVLKNKIKKEIIERVAELQKVTELKQKYL